MKTGLFTINGTDIYEAYGAFLAELERNGHENNDELMAMPEVKDYTTVDFREEDGEQDPEELLVKLKPMDRTLQFALIADSEEERQTKYRGFMTLLLSGKLTCVIEGYGTYELRYKSAEKPGWYMSDTRRFLVTVKVTFHEPKPKRPDAV